MSSPGGARPPALLVIALLGFAAFLVVLVGQSLTPKRVTTFVPSPAGTAPRVPVPGRVDTVTLDARDAESWRYFDLDIGLVRVPPDTQGWDLAVRRFQIITPDTTTGSIGRWYSYGFLSHVLRPKPRVYVVRTDAGREMNLEILSYYCPGPEAGCLTFRFAPEPRAEARARPD
jgi:hypothetical protein